MYRPPVEPWAKSVGDAFEKVYAELDNVRADLKAVAMAAKAYLIDSTEGGALIPAKGTGSGNVYDGLTAALDRPGVKKILDNK